MSAASEESLTSHLEATLADGRLDLRVATDEGPGGVWLTEDDVRLARALSAVAARHGAVAAPAEVTQVEMGLDTADRVSLAPFWGVVLTGSTDGVDDNASPPPWQRAAPWWTTRRRRRSPSSPTPRATGSASVRSSTARDHSRVRCPGHGTRDLSG